MNDSFSVWKVWNYINERSLNCSDSNFRNWNYSFKPLLSLITIDREVFCCDQWGNESKVSCERTSRRIRSVLMDWSSFSHKYCDLLWLVQIRTSYFLADRIYWQIKRCVYFDRITLSEFGSCSSYFLYWDDLWLYHSNVLWAWVRSQ